MIDEKGRTKLQKALAMNEPLSQAYYLKEDLREIYNQPTINEAEEKLNSQVSMALEIDSKPLMSLANTIKVAKKEILADTVPKKCVSPNNAIFVKYKLLTNRQRLV